MAVLFEIVSALLAALGSAATVDASEAVRKLLRRLAPTKADVSHVEVRSAEAPDSLAGTILTITRRELTLEERLAELADLMSRSSTLVEQVSAELDARPQLHKGCKTRPSRLRN